MSSEARCRLWHQLDIFIVKYLRMLSCYPKEPFRHSTQGKMHLQFRFVSTLALKALFVTQFLHICRLLNPKWRLPEARSSSTGKEKQPQSSLRFPVNRPQMKSGKAHKKCLEYLLEIGTPKLNWEKVCILAIFVNKTSQVVCWRLRASRRSQEWSCCWQ